MATAKTVKVKSNLARVDSIGYAYGKHSGGSSQALTLRLLPGVNEVPVEQWEAAKKLSYTQHHLKEKNFEELGAISKPGLKQYTVEGAIELVEATFDRELLRQWKGVETREPVIAAIEVQIGNLAPVKPTEGTDGQKNLEVAPDLAPRSAATGFTASELATQVQTGNAEPTADEIAAAAAAVKDTTAAEAGKAQTEKQAAGKAQAAKPKGR
jgi:hypothetical protein